MVENTIPESEVLQKLAQIKDPEVPVINIVELGILRRIEQPSAELIRVTITPTYSGCPAMDFIKIEIKQVLQSIGFQDITILEEIAPPWSTDDMSPQARLKLKEYGIAPPRLRDQKEVVRCPQCDSTKVAEVSRFGSTSCKAMYKCEKCLEPFEYFKCI